MEHPASNGAVFGLPVVRCLAVLFVGLPVSITPAGQPRTAEPHATLVAGEGACSSTASRPGLDQQLRRALDLGPTTGQATPRYTAQG
jgi:hypothetical protein